jgi:hypothetical protein
MAEHRGIEERIQAAGRARVAQQVCGWVGLFVCLGVSGRVVLSFFLSPCLCCVLVGRVGVGLYGGPRAGGAAGGWAGG